ncbi:hypothetical protein KA005_73810, partial [bacterium]|nr:hypothetical protein [bacterium]
MPIERFKESYKNWRWNPFTATDMAVDKEEDGLLIPAGSPFVVQLLEVPRYNDPTSVSVRCYGVATDVDQDSASGQKVLYVTSTTGFSPGDLIVINRGGDRDEDKIIDTVQAGVSLTVTVNLTYAHTAAQGDDVEKYIEFVEVSGAPTQSQYRVDYPPEDGEGTGLLDFNQNDAEKEFRVNYKATGSPALEETLDTKVSYPAGDPVDNQILRFASGAPAWRYNPIRYFHEGPVIYNASGEDESCLLFRFKRGADEEKVILELKGAKLHQGYYSELFQHNHGVGSLVNAAASNHTHGVGTYTIPAASNHAHGNGTLDADDVGTHTHAKGTLAGSQPTHQHTDGTLAGSQPNHTHGYGTIAVVAVGTHTHADGSLVGSQPAHSHGFTGTSAGGSNHSHVINDRSHRHADVTSGGSQTEFANGCSSPTANEGAHTHGKGSFAVGARALTITVAGSTAVGGVHNHSLSGSVAASGDDAVTVTGNTANAGVTAKTY